GNLQEVCYLYIQDGKVIQNSKTTIAGMATFDSVSEDFCDAQRNSRAVPATLVYLPIWGKGYSQWMVLVLSVWHGHAANMLWLDSAYPHQPPHHQPRYPS
ncbi:glycoside hydrolase, partial [Cyathus striatus]